MHDIAHSAQCDLCDRWTPLHDLFTRRGRARRLAVCRTCADRLYYDDDAMDAEYNRKPEQPA